MMRFAPVLMVSITVSGDTYCLRLEEPNRFNQLQILPV